MPILITGAAGFIGSNLVDRLLADGREGRCARQFRPLLFARAENWRIWSRRGESPVQIHRRRLWPWVARVACRFGGESRRDRGSRRESRGSAQHRTALRLCSGERGRHGASVGSGVPDEPEAEVRLCVEFERLWRSARLCHFARPTSSTCRSAHTPRSKKACELFCGYTFHHIHGLPATGLRFFTAVFGPRNRPDLAIAKFTGLIDRGESVPMFGDGSPAGATTHTLPTSSMASSGRWIIARAVPHLYNLGNSSPIELREHDQHDRRCVFGQACTNRLSARTAGRCPPDFRRHFAC